MRKVRKGDRIHCMGITVTIQKVFYYDWWETWDIEFIDTEGNYRHWKQAYDGGEFFPRQRRAYDWYGTDVTDLYVKYGQPIYYKSAP